MDAKKLIELRKVAEKAVQEMPDGPMKVKAFEVVLTHLLAGGAPSTQPATTEDIRTERGRKVKGNSKAQQTDSAAGRILVLQDEGFFKSQKTIGEVREELKAHGWHYPLTSLSGVMQQLIRQRNLRRERAKQGNKKIWKYSNP